MAIVGMASLIYGVDDLALCTRFFEDFGLPLVSRTESESLFRLAEGSTVVVRPLANAHVAGSAIVGAGVQETIFGVDTAENLESLIRRVGTDRPVARDDDGTAHFLADGGIPIGLRVFTKRPVVCSPDPLNAPGHVNRLNRNRRYRKRAIPKVLQHVVFAVPNFEQVFRFFAERLDFRLSDYQPTYGIYSRCDGANNHHNLFLLNASLPFPGLDGQTRFHHANFGVEDLDEIMIGANYMVRQGWDPSFLGLGRHRTDSALFYYLPCPAGGEAEYGADGDYIDDAWVPRFWTSPAFGYTHFAHNLPPFLMEEPAWDVRYFSEDDFIEGAPQRPGPALAGEN